MAPKRRPAAAAVGLRGARVRRRPAAAVFPVVDRPLELCKLGLEEMDSLGDVLLKKATYYHREVEVCGRLTGCRREGGQTFFEMEVQGTQDEELLRVLTGISRRKATVHACGEGCARELSGEGVIHAREYEEVKGGKDPWMTNLLKAAGDESEDENARLRTEAEKAKEDEGREKSPKEKKRKDKKKKKDSKEKKEEDKKDGSEEAAEPGQKSLKLLYEDTGLDPSLKKRSKILKKAKRLGRGKKKKKKKGSSDSRSQSSKSSTSSTSSHGGDGGLFENEKKLKQLWQRYPGALAAQSVREAQSQLVTAAGTSYSQDRRSLPPVMTQYVRQVVIPGTSAPMGQEILSTAQAIDGLLVGRVASSVDLLCQRLKSLESLAKGNHWSVGRQLELVRLDQVGLTDEAEARQAARQAKEEEKLKGLVQRPYNYKGGDYGKGKKGKDSKGGAKGGSGEPQGGGKGKDTKREENKGGWQKK